MGAGKSKACTLDPSMQILWSAMKRPTMYEVIRFVEILALLAGVAFFGTMLVTLMIECGKRNGFY